MAKNKRKVYGADDKERGAEVSQCAVCGCRHFEVTTEKVGETVRTVRKCRHCGAQIDAG